MPNTPDISEARRALLEKYMRGEIPQATRATSAVTHRAKAEASDQRARVVAIQASGSKRPFFFLHGQWNRDAFYCFPLARSLGSDQPFYALEPYRFNDLPVPPTLEAIAAAHLKLMRAVQPDGPYLLGGWCNGGLVAYEMARQLHAEGQALDLLALMNPAPLVYPTFNRLTRGVVSRFGNLVRLGPDKQLNWYILQRHACIYLLDLLYKGSKDSEHLETAQQFGLERKRDKAGFTLRRLASIFPTTESLHEDYWAVFDWLAISYKPPSLYPGKITFFWSSKWPWRKGWHKVEESREVEAHEFAGTHLTLRTVDLQVLAEHLRICLSKAQATALID